MKIGKRTQAYFVGFLVGVAMVSILVDSRRERALGEQEDVFSWVRSDASLEVLPDAVVAAVGAQGYVTGVILLKEDGIATGEKGYFFADAAGKRYWYHGTDAEMTLYDGEKFAVTSQPGLEWDLMKAGFEHQGHQLISRRAMAPNYVLAIDVHSAIEMTDAYENLRSKSNYIASVDWVEVPVEGAFVRE